MDRARIRSLYEQREKVEGTIRELRKILPHAIDKQFIEKYIKLQLEKLIQIENEIYGGK